MTNLALMMRADGDCVRNRIGQVISMGGALDVPGNHSPVAECSYLYCCPKEHKELTGHMILSQLLRRSLCGERVAHLVGNYDEPRVAA